MNAVIAPSILSADFAKLGEQIAAAEAGGAGMIHVDVMDGHFVPNITIGPLVTEAVRRVTDLPVDCHLMISDPDRYIEDFRKAGADMISVHVEAATHLHRTVQRIRELGAKPGVAINPATPIEQLSPILADIDYVVVMTVNPGFGGQKMIPSCLDKVRALRTWADRERMDLRIQIDGGITVDNLAESAEAGMDWIVAGSSVFGSDDITGTVQKMSQTLLQVAEREQQV